MCHTVTAARATDTVRALTAQPQRLQVQQICTDESDGQKLTDASAVTARA